jgi:hypothetical protein
MKKITLAFLLAFVFSKASAQFTNILISPTGCTEPSICIDPTNPARVVAATNCTYSYYSADSGQTWSPCNNLTITPGLWCYDACIVADYNGNFYYFHNYESQPLPRKTVQKSLDGGATWSIDSDVNGLYDKEMVCLRPTNNTLYAVYIPLTGGFNNVGFSKSTDGAITWDTMTYVNSQTYTGIQWGAAPAVGTAPGELYVVWENSTGVYFQRSFDDGNTWMPNDMNLSTWLNMSNGYDCMPSIATDLTTGPGSGNIYITWWELDVNGTDTDIYFAKSDDQGSTWNITGIASDINTDQKWPQITVDQSTGYIYVVYYNQFGATTTYDIKMAYSADGGNTFISVPVSVSPATVTNWYHHYIGNSAVNGVIRPAWTDNNSLYTALMSQSQIMLWLGVQDFNVQSPLNIFPNPSAGVLNVSSAEAGELRVFNSQGKVVYLCTLTGEQTTVDISYLPAGLYLASLKTKKGTAEQKIIKR